MVKNIFEVAAQIADSKDNPAALAWLKRELQKEEVAGLLPDYMTIHEAMEVWDEPELVYDTGFSSLDKVAGIEVPGIIVIPAIVGHGKTSFLLELMFRLINRHGSSGYGCAFFSYEVTRKKVMKNYALKLWNYFSDIRYTKSLLEDAIKNSAEMRGKLAKMLSMILPDKTEDADKPYLLLDDKNYTASQLDKVILSTLESYPHVKFIFIDYLQLIRTESQENRTQEIERLMSELLDIVKKHNIAIIAPAQIKRPDKGYATKESTLTLHRIKQSSDIANYASLVLGLWNYTVAECQNGESFSTDCHDIEVSILKTRVKDGEYATNIPLRFFPKFSVMEGG